MNMTSFITVSSVPSLQKIISWIKPRSYAILLVLIMVAGAVLRFYQLTTHLHFDIDEATHTNTIYSIWRDHHLISKGPPASGDTALYHGAYYYYLYLIPAILAHGNPLGLAAFTIVLSVAAIWLLAHSTEMMFGRTAALAASFVYMISYFGIIYSRWIWNPNSIPFFMALSLYALAQLSKGQKRYLILFSFAVASITQLHVGGLVFLPVAVGMMPLLIKQVREVRIWTASTVAFLIPWVPTIYHELAHGFELVHALIKMLHSPTHDSLMHHAVRGFDYLDFMFKVVTQLPHLMFLLVTIGAAAFLYFQARDHPERRLMIWYLFLVMLFSHLVYSFYPGILYIHVSEHLFIVYPLLVGLFIADLAKDRVLLWTIPVLLLTILHLNWPLYVGDVVSGEAQYGMIKRTCQTISHNGDASATVLFNNRENPIPVTYICKTQFSVASPGFVHYLVKTNFKDQYSITRQP